jgi:hypothetical protein
MSAPEYPTYRNDSSASPTELGVGERERLSETAKADMATISEEVSKQAAAIGEEAKAQVGELAEKAKGMASEQKDLVATQLGGVSEAIDKVAGELESQNQAAAQYVRMLADGASRLTSTVRDNNVDDILAMAQDFGRKQPAAFLGVAALLGFASSRFVMASAHRDRQGRSDGQAGMRPASAYSPNDSAPGYARSAGGDDVGI